VPAARKRARRPSYEELAAALAERDALIGDQAAAITGLKAWVAELQSQNKTLLERIVELERRLGQNSRNSSRPSSSEGYGKPSPKKRSLRRRSGRGPGGQEGHEGSHLERVESPDRVIVHEPEGPCEGCGRDLKDAEELEGGESRQVIDIPEKVAREVIEHLAKHRRCSACGREHAGRFPADVRAPVVYGANLRAHGVYLIIFQHIPYDRARQLILDTMGVRLSTGTLKAWVDRAAAGLTEFDEQLRKLIVDSPVAHFDETGMRIATRLGWVHCASTQTLTCYSAHAKRGRAAMEDAGVLGDFRGAAVHDNFAPYRVFTDTVHALCGAHHLRELIAAEEVGQAWASGIGCLLLDTNDAIREAKAAGLRALTEQALAELGVSYRALIAYGYEENPGLAENAGKKIKRSKAQNLLLRLDAREAEALRFAHDFNVPFTNNLCESDIRMVKLQQKISGCFRSMEGAEHFLAIRSYISTARKQGQDTLGVLQALAQGRPWLPAAAET
jgi:transposase